MFTNETRKPSFNWTGRIFGFEKKLLFLSGNVLVLLPIGHVNVRKTYVNSIILGEVIIL